MSSFQAMASGLPLVMCDNGGTANLVGETQYPRAIANAIRRLVADADLRLAVPNNARVRIAEVALWAGRPYGTMELLKSVTQERAAQSPAVR